MKKFTPFLFAGACVFITAAVPADATLAGPIVVSDAVECTADGVVQQLECGPTITVDLGGGDTMNCAHRGGVSERRPPPWRVVAFPSRLSATTVRTVVGGLPNPQPSN